MRVLYFHQHFSTPAGAAGGRSYAFARKLIERGHDVTMVCGSYGSGHTGLDGPFVRGCRHGKVGGIDVVEFEVPYSNKMTFFRRTVAFLSFAMRSSWLALREPYDVLFATSTPLTAAIPGIVARWLRRKPFVFEVRDLWPDLPRDMGVIGNPVVLFALRLLEVAAYRSAETCIGLAPGIVAGIDRRRRGSEPSAMIPNGCDLDLFTPVSRLREPGTPFRAVYAGTHGLANGLHAALDVARVLKRQGRDDIRIELIGDGALKPELARHAELDGLTNCVFRDPLPREGLAAELPKIDVGLQILANVKGFYDGTSPNKFFDYLSSGIPVLLNYPGWLAELVTERECGVGVEPDNPVAFAEALVYLADNPERCRVMGGNARRLAEKEFARGRLAAKFVDLLENTVAD